MRPQNGLKQMVTVVSWLPPTFAPRKVPGSWFTRPSRCSLCWRQGPQGLLLGNCPAQGSQPITQGLGSRSLSSCLCG